MRENVLPRQFNYFVKNVLEMQNVKVPDDKRGQEPVTEMHTVVVIEVIPNVGSRELAVIIVRMLALGNILI